MSTHAVVAPSRVLIVDDEPTVARALQRALGRQHEVDIAGDARRGLEMLNAPPGYDVVFCDILMPGMDGMRFAEEAVGYDPRMAERLIMMSGNVVEGGTARLADGRELYTLGKPFELVDVMQLVDRMVAGG